jgi:hypothetical protein
MHLSSTHNSRRLLLQCPMFRRSIWGQQDAQNACSAWPQPTEAPEVVAPGYVEDAPEARTMLAGFFSILPENYLRVRTDWSAKLTRGLGKRPNRITPATAQANTKERVGEVTRRGGATEEGLGSRIYITMTTLI